MNILQNKTLSSTGGGHKGLKSFINNYTFNIGGGV